MFVALCVLFVRVAFLFFLLLRKLVCNTHVFPCTCIIICTNVCVAQCLISIGFSVFLHPKHHQYIYPIAPKQTHFTPSFELYNKRSRTPNRFFVGIIDKTHAVSYLISICVFRKDKVTSLPFKVVQKTPIGHIWHHNVRCRASIKAHSNKAHHMSMFEPTHCQTLFNKFIHSTLIKKSWRNRLILNKDNIVHLNKPFSVLTATS